MLEKRHDRVVEMRLCFFLGKVGDYKVSLVATRMCRSTFEKADRFTERQKEKEAQAAKTEKAGNEQPDQKPKTKKHDMEL